MKDEPETEPGEPRAPGSSTFLAHPSPFRVAHVIRLRGAWEATADGTHTLHTRKFGRPRTLDPHERLWLVCARVPAQTEVMLNGVVTASAAESGSIAVDVTDGLRPRNAVSFRVAGAGAIGEVHLEVRVPSA